MDRELVGQIAAPPGCADGIDVSDDVGHGDIRRRELFDEAILSRHPRNGSIVAVTGDSFAARAANGLERIVVDFATRYYRHLRIEQVDEGAQNTALGLASQAKENEIVSREQGIDNLRDDGVLVAVYAGEERLALFDRPKQIAAQLILN